MTLLKNETDSVVDIHDLYFYRGERAIFSGLNLSIPRGKIVAVLGPSGTGKTTLLHLMGGLLEPDGGSIQVLGESLGDIGRARILALRKRMGMLFQSGALFTGMTVYDNVAFPLRELTNLSEALIRDIVLLKLEAVGLRGAAKLMPGELSGGMARRVALARAVSLDPEILFYDEPFTGQDPISMGVVVKLIQTLNDVMDLTSVVVTHDVNEIFSIADYAYILSDGVVIGEGEPESLRTQASDRVVQFVNGMPDGPVSFHYPAQDIRTQLIGEAS